VTERTITAGRFKEECLAVLDQVASTGEAFVVTKGGKAIARVGPVEHAPSLLGTVIFNVTDDELIHGPLDKWDVERA
jgi:antitoxin (DNA-binding transcriptional repressor) of toxin-antitoxin stability system